MEIDTVFILVSSLSFFAYGVAYFISPKMKNEFKRFGIEKLGLIIIVLEFMGATGLILGLLFKPVLVISSLGLATLMLLGLIVRIRLRDNLWISLPALFYLVLNTYILWVAIN